VPTVYEPSEVTDDLVAAVARLVRQLSTSAPPPTKDELAAMVDSPATTLILACGDGPVGVAPAGTTPLEGGGEVVGMLTLAVFRIPTGLRAWIEDVVVDEAARGRGVGAVLTHRALELAAAAGAKTVELTSRPSREAANRLYRRLGFEPRETNVYRYREPPA
jgi:ribosomal protein S18 acetylase RimI-like enzyme